MECYGGMGKANGLSPNESENELCLSNNDVVDENDLRKVELLSDEDGREYGYVTGLTAEDIMKKVFRSEEHAYEFFGRLGKCNGFGVRKGDYAKDEDGSVVRRRFFCNRAGLRDGKHYNRLDRKRCHRPETRTNCQALMSVYLDKGSSVWKVRKVILEHNHELIPTGMVHMIRSFRAISGSAKAHMDGMHTKMWANAYLRRKFCAGFRTTSRCEGINSHLKKFLSSRHTILELVQNLELLVREYRNNELVAQFSSIYGVPVMTTRLDPIEQFAASVYTKVIFTQVKKEIESISIVNFVSKRRVSTTMVYTVEEYGFPGQNVVALYDPKRGRLVCRCGFWEKEGFPCRHMFFVMKHEHIKRIPESLILRRWRKDVKTVNEYIEKTGLEDERGFLLRHGALHAASQWMLFVGSKNDDLYKKCMSGIRQICYDLEARSGNDTMDRSPNAAGAVRDPTVVRTKGAPSTRGHKGKKRRCMRCRKTGHTKRRCTEPQKMSTSTRYTHCPKKETRVTKLEVVSPHFDVHADQGKWLEEGDDCRIEQDGGANDRWDHVIGTAQSQTRNMRGVANTVDWNIEVIDFNTFLITQRTMSHEIYASAIVRQDHGKSEHHTLIVRVDFLRNKKRRTYL
ncbi:hypothetical protein Ahy_A03g011015 [Arachis hypogaea]|uniref:Uncharacterized protein n=1 Tax=Arachis hypogaea TaxID=3818 RepID=A0A445DPB2_ARAHY|nr:hypothetical protein Ahy_A03g011015 [Arachis hypogaea]